MGYRAVGVHQNLPRTAGLRKTQDVAVTAAYLSFQSAVQHVAINKVVSHVISSHDEENFLTEGQLTDRTEAPVGGH